MTTAISTTKLIAMLQDARARTLELIDDLDQQQLIGPRIGTVNPLQWEIGHVAYFYEYFILRQLYGRDSLLGNQQADALYDSILVPHDTRWDLPLLSLADTKNYLQSVLDQLCERLDKPLASEADSFIYQFGVFHENMHCEAFLWGRQTLAYQTPKFANATDMSAERTAGAHPGFVDVPGGKFKLGADPQADFMFDNEKFAHELDAQAFSIAKAPVTNAEFAEFVAAGGYQQDHYWCAEGLHWKRQNHSTHPGYWIADGPDNWLLRRFDQTMPLPANEPVSHVNWYEANAYCRWAGLRLPTELEWEVAALGERNADGSLALNKRIYPWGNTIQPGFTNLDGRALGCVDVAAFADGDSVFGCRQMLGNVWEWTSDTFQPYPEFSADAYQDYSRPLFGTTKVLRGGAWTSRSRMLHGTCRNFFEPERWDIFSGFRTCKP
ncbi:MAG: iron(II)-dependent oxidoreductase [Gammaproteobacteria bacterium]|jgi:iron(II)-dependent oxidoreductase